METKLSLLLVLPQLIFFQKTGITCAAKGPLCPYDLFCLPTQKGGCGGSKKRYFKLLDRYFKLVDWNLKFVNLKVGDPELKDGSTSLVAWMLPVCMSHQVVILCKWPEILRSIEPEDMRQYCIFVRAKVVSGNTLACFFFKAFYSWLKRR